MTNLNLWYAITISKNFENRKKPHWEFSAYMDEEIEAPEFYETHLKSYGWYQGHDQNPVLLTFNLL